MSEAFSLYKDSTTDLNQGYRELLGYLSIGDTRVAYLRTFELILSQLCPGKQLWNFANYVRLEQMQPLPSEMRKRIPSEIFLNYLIVYEQIMREADLLDKKPREEEKTAAIELADMGVYL